MTYKILCLDGGGMRGVISAQILEEIEKTVWDKHKKKLHEYFDLIAGTSTGSILAAGIACGMSAQQLIDVYKHEGKNIFLESVRRQRNFRWLSRLFGSTGLYPHKKGEDEGLVNVLKEWVVNQYYPDEKGKGLANVLEENLKLRDNNHEVKDESHFPTMEDIEKPQLLIPAYDVKSRNTTWFANDDSREWWYKNKTKLWQICTASASAPTFFPPCRLEHVNEEDEKKILPHIDGGVSTNNPTLAAIAHALNMGKKIDEITVISIGTGQTTHSYEYEEIEKWGLKDWAMKIPDIFLDPSAENSEHISMRIFKGIKPKNYLRLNLKLGEVDDQVAKKFIPKIKEFVDRKIKELFPTENEKNDNLKIYKEDDNDYKCKNTFKISQKIDIDNPDICDFLITASEVYLSDGEVYYDKYEDRDVRKRVEVKKAIKEFFDNVKKQDDEQQLEKVCSECPRRGFKPMYEQELLKQS